MLSAVALLSPAPRLLYQYYGRFKSLISVDALGSMSYVSLIRRNLMSRSTVLRADDLTESQVLLSYRRVLQSHDIAVLIGYHYSCLPTNVCGCDEFCAYAAERRSGP